MPTHIRRKGDVLTPIGATLKRPDGSVVDLTDLEVKFKMLDSNGAEKVALTGATKVDAVKGQVQYDFQSADVDTAGTFYAYFVTEDSGEQEHFPVVSRNLVVKINED